MQTIDTLINARWVIPVEPDGQTLDHHSIAVHNGKIVEVLPTKDAAKKYRATETVDLKTHAVIPQRTSEELQGQVLKYEYWMTKRCASSCVMPPRRNTLFHFQAAANMAFRTDWGKVTGTKKLSG